jgi:exopolyphosphatase/guanosine-5'-triphosphate,3'-diphosphate pyrophosphatase
MPGGGAGHEVERGGWMSGIVPRWEWRTFGESFGGAEDRIRSHGAGKVRTSSETYIVSVASSTNTKVRDGLLDIKKLQQVDENALEQWYPVMKAGFPLSPIVILDVFRAWNTPMPRVAREGYDFDQLVRELVEPSLSLRAVQVIKERHGYTINGCIVEIADLKFDGVPIRTVGVEMEDPARVTETVAMLSLERFENVNYVRALKRFKGISDA